MLSDLSWFPQRSVISYTPALQWATNHPSSRFAWELRNNVNSTFIVPVTVVNHGDETAEGVRIEVVMESGGEVKARGEFDIPFVPRHATREGWVTFEQDPRTAQLKARVLGYQKP